MTTMKLDSKFFDRLRVKPKEERVLHDATPSCEWKGCKEAGLYPAPKGRGREGQYFRFCLDHVRQYNKSYNYFEGLDDEALQKHLKDDIIGHRPTWAMGGRSSSSSADSATAERPNAFAYAFGLRDPYELFGEDQRHHTASPHRPHRPIMNAERKCLRQLDLEDRATKPEIRARFKELVMRLHPDHNGGDRSAEDKLREVIQAYNYLREVGLA
jgi:hypothetical protein